MESLIEAQCVGLTEPGHSHKNLQMQSTRAWFLYAVLFLTGTVLAGVPVTRGEKFFFQDGDRPAVFLGDSITEQRMYTTYIETYVLSRYPRWNITFRNIGWGGDTSWLSRREGFDAGLKRDILPLHPVAITIDFGMNDARGGEATYDKYVTYSTKLVEQLKSAGARVALLTPSPEEKYEANQPAGSAYNRLLWKYSLGLQKIAEQEGVQFVDQQTPFVRVIETGRQAGVLGSAGGSRLIPDGVHPNWAGHLVMATAILKGLGATAAVRRATIDARTGQILIADGCDIEMLPAPSGTLAFRRTDRCLPWFIPVEGRFALQVPGFTPLAELSQYELCVTNLIAANYQLTIDDVEVGVFQQAQLANGVNLSLQAGPITAQAEKLFTSVISKNELYQQRWRSVQVFSLPNWLQGPEAEVLRQKELARLDSEITSREQALNALRQPVPHIFKLRPVEAAPGK